MEKRYILQLCLLVTILFLPLAGAESAALYQAGSRGFQSRAQEITSIHTRNARQAGFASARAHDAHHSRPSHLRPSRPKPFPAPPVLPRPVPGITASPSWPTNSYDRQRQPVLPRMTPNYLNPGLNRGYERYPGYGIFYPQAVQPDNYRRPQWLTAPPELPAMRERRQPYKNRHSSRSKNTRTAKGDF